MGVLLHDHAVETATDAYIIEVKRDSTAKKAIEQIQATGPSFGASFAIASHRASRRNGEYASVPIPEPPVADLGNICLDA